MLEPFQHKKSKAMRQLLLFSLLLGCLACQSQPPTSMSNQDPLLCNPDSGLCELPAHRFNPQGQTQQPASTGTKPIQVLYFTDPICSSCWGIEAQLRKLKLEYGHCVELDYRMGGLLPDWSYNSGGISKPSDVAQHWDEVSVHYDMPIDGDVWLEDPLDSSYPPSIAFKAAQLQDKAKALVFLRELRELVFLRKTNITRWAILETAAKKAGLDPQQFKTDFSGPARHAFQTDLELARALGVRGFPTLLFVHADGRREMLYGAVPYSGFEQVVLKLQPGAVRAGYSNTWESLFSIYPSLTAREFTELSGMPRSAAEELLVQLARTGRLEQHATKNGSVWTLKPAPAR